MPPWIVGIYKEELRFGKKTYRFRCFGSLIHAKIVLTAAQCISEGEPADFKVLSGQYDISFSIENNSYMKNVSQLVIHEHYENYARYGNINDIVLLVLADEYVISGNISTISLPPLNQNFDLQRCLVSVFEIHNVRDNDHRFRTLELPIVPRDKCVMELRNARILRQDVLHDSFICAGGEIGKATCTGDGGAPLVCPVPNTVNRYQQVGIVSWGACDGSTPGKYFIVTSFCSLFYCTIIFRGFC